MDGGVGQAERRAGWGEAAAVPLLAVGEAAAATAERTGRKVTAVFSVREAVDRWREGGGFAATFAEADDSAELAREGVRVVALAGAGAVEAADRALADGAVDVLDPDATFDEIERVLGEPRAGVAESSHLHGANLAELSAEAARIAKALESLAQQEPRPDGAAAPVTAVYVRGVIRTRRARGQFFKGELFADPAWDILLDLMAARLERKQVSVSSLCIAAAVPPTTALRWIKGMTDEGLLERKPDPIDGRRVFIDLSDGAADAMLSYLGQAMRSAAI